MRERISCSRLQESQVIYMTQQTIELVHFLLSKLPISVTRQKAVETRLLSKRQATLRQRLEFRCAQSDEEVRIVCKSTRQLVICF